MESGDFSTEVSVDVLTPASSVRPAGANSPNQDPQAKSRRQTRDQEASEEASESDAKSEHQIDRLA